MKDEGSSKFKLRTNVYALVSKLSLVKKFNFVVCVDSLEKYSHQLDHEWNIKCFAIMIKPLKLFRKERKFHQTEVS